MGAFVFSPLGPFVPAPPEIAMHMLREQGPSPFEPNGGPHGNSGVLGSMMGGGPAPIIAMPPSFHHDPRRLRRLVVSYDDAKFNCLVIFICSRYFLQCKATYVLVAFSNKIQCHYTCGA